MYCRICFRQYINPGTCINTNEKKINNKNNNHFHRPWLRVANTKVKLQRFFRCSTHTPVDASIHMPLDVWDLLRKSSVFSSVLYQFVIGFILLQRQLLLRL